MRTILPIKFIFFFFLSFSTSAQNLVPDPGFEIMRRTPVKHDNSAACTRNWMSPTSEGASDYYNKAGDRHAGVPKNIFGRQKPHSGNGYAGICIRKKFIEYLGTKLSDTLIKDRDYLVEFYVSRAERSIGSVNQFGILFVKKNMFGHPGNGIDIKPGVDSVSPSGFRNKKKWMKVSQVYHAEGYETALVLGYFNYDKKNKFKGISHYYVDDVSVSLIERTEKAAAAMITKADVPVQETFSPKPDQRITLKNIFFLTNKSELLPESFPELDKLAEYLERENENLIEIAGHTDNTGNENMNKILSEARAKAVADYLLAKGIDQARIKYAGYGSSMPVALNGTEEERQQNRRVEFVIRKK
jgi:outer membrane protein OmpA-like peptidoglycan-associated protein